MKDWENIQNWFKEAYEKTLDGISKFSERIQKQIEEYAFDEKKKKEYKEGFNTIGEGFQAIFKGLTVLATSSAKSLSELLVHKEKKANEETGSSTTISGSTKKTSSGSTQKK